MALGLQLQHLLLKRPDPVVCSRLKELKQPIRSIGALPGVGIHSAAGLSRHETLLPAPLQQLRQRHLPKTRELGSKGTRVLGLTRHIRPGSSAEGTSSAVQCVSLLPRPLTYSTRLGDADPVQVAELWETTLGCHRDPSQVIKALRHSYSLVVVLDESSGDQPPKVIGIGRAVSDGAFVATVCDVAVAPGYQKRGVGRRIVRELVKDMRGRGPSGFAAFPPPLSRRFFWHLGFRPDKKYRLMAYQGQFLTCSEEDRRAQGTALGVSLGSLLTNIHNARNSRSIFQHGDSLDDFPGRGSGSSDREDVRKGRELPVEREGQMRLGHSDGSGVAMVLRQVPGVAVAEPEKALQPR